MKSVKNIILFMCGILCLNVYAKAQNLLEELEHIKSVLRDPNHFHAEIEITVDYCNAVKDEHLPNKINTTIKINDGNYFFENEMVSMVINSNWVVGVMHGQKQIVYGRNNSKELARARKLAISKNLPIEQSFIDKASKIGQEGNIVHYQISNPEENIKRIDFYIDTDTKFFHKVVYEYADPSKAGVVKTTTVFKKLDTKATFDENTFSEKLFLLFSADGKVSPVAKYKAYQILFTDPQLLKDF